MNCKNCGGNLTPGAVSCPKCGTPVVGVQSIQQVVPVQNPIPSPNVTINPTLVMQQQPVMPQQPVQQPMMPQQPVQQPVMPQQPVQQPVMPQPSPIPVQQQPAPQPAIVGAPVQSSNNGESKKGLFVGIIVVLALAVLGFGGYFVYDKIQENKDKEEAKELLDELKKEEKKDKEQKEELKAKVSVKEYKKLSNGSLLLTVENKSTMTVGADIKIEYYDAYGNSLGSEIEYIDVAPESERYVFVSQYSVKEGYETIKTNVSAMDYSKIVKIQNVNEIDMAKNVTKDEIILQYNNKTKDEFNLNVLCLFYSNNELVYVLEDYDHGITSGNNANINLYLYDIKDVTYDRYELFSYAEYNIYND